MSFEKELQELIIYDRKKLFSRLKKLKSKLDINKKMDNVSKFIDDIDSIFLNNLDIKQGSFDIKEQLSKNANKRLELRCVIEGKREYLKGFGLIKNIKSEKLKDIFEFLILMRLSKKISEVSYYASQHYRIDKVIKEVTNSYK